MRKKMTIEDSYKPDIPFFTYKEDNCVIRLQKSAMVILPVQETPEEKI
jgi:hypothetical protein